MELSPDEERFAEQLAHGKKPARAYFLTFGGQEPVDYDTCERRGHSLARKPAIRYRMRQIKAEMAQEAADLAKIDVPYVLKKFLLMAQADPNELISVRVGSCRYCHGDGHGYQWTQAEYLKALEDWERTAPTMATPPPMPNIAGGLDFDRTRDPHPECPECHGLGVERIELRDTTELSEAAALLYQGAKVTKDGVQVLMVDRLKAWESVARILGAFKDSVDVNAKVNAAVQAVHQAVANPEDAQRAYLAMIANDGPGG